MAEIMFAMMGADIPALTVEKDLCVTDFKPIAVIILKSSNIYLVLY
jgi:hypothetical protein